MYTTCACNIYTPKDFAVPFRTSNMKWKLPSSSFLAAFFVVLLVEYNFGQSVPDSSNDNDETTITNTASDNDANNVAFAPLSDKPNEYVLSSRVEIRLGVRRWLHQKTKISNPF